MGPRVCKCIYVFKILGMRGEGDERERRVGRGGNERGFETGGGPPGRNRMTERVRGIAYWWG